MYGLQLFGKIFHVILSTFSRIIDKKFLKGCSWWKDSFLSVGVTFWLSGDIMPSGHPKRCLPLDCGTGQNLFFPIYPKNYIIKSQVRPKFYQTRPTFHTLRVCVDKEAPKKALFNPRVQTRYAIFGSESPPRNFLTCSIMLQNIFQEVKAINYGP